MFDEVYGHHRVKKVLSQMVARDGLAQALCFVGPDGIGKRTLGMSLARVLLCQERTCCGTCPHCVKTAHGVHPDFELVAPDGKDIKVDQIRSIAEKLHFRPFEARLRVILVDQVDKMRDEAANAFLKSLEEPPDYVHFVLVTADWNALLPTIRSRCQKVKFQGLRRDDKVQLLVKHHGLEVELANRLASISFRQLEVDEEAWKRFDQHVETCLSLLESCVDHGGAPGLLGDLVRDKAELPIFLDHVLVVVRILTHVACGMQVDDVLEHRADRVRALADKARSGDWRRAWSEIMRLQARRRMNPNVGLWFDQFALNELGSLGRARNAHRQRLQSR